MKISFSWFKSKKKEEMEDLLIEEQKLKVAKLKKVLEREDIAGKINVEFKEDTKPYKTIRLVNDVLTVVLQDGSIIVKMDSNADDFAAVRNASNELEIAKVMSSEKAAKEKEDENKEYKKAEKIIKGVDILKTSDDFVIKDNIVYLKGIDRSIPPLLVEKFAEIVSIYNPSGEDFNDMDGILADDEEYVALKRFFMWACLNPRAEVADQLYEFLQKNGMRITKQGFFVALRNVVNVAGDDSEIVDFISNAYNKIKGVWKKKPVDYVVYSSDDFKGYKFTKSTTVSTSDFQDRNHTVLGNLQDLYVDLPNMRENRFTDNWTRTFDIRIGKPVIMKPEECSWSTQDCAEAGLRCSPSI